MRKTNHKRILSLFMVICMLLMFFQSHGAMPEAGPEYLKSVTYVSDAWVINFWNTESDHMEEELAQIGADGFNSIILVVPWREFQPGTNPVRYNSYAFDKMNQVMQAAKEQGLQVILRVSYTWDYYESEQPTLRFRQLLGDGQLRSAWLEYMKTVYQAAAEHDNFYGGFITWEDFWNYMEDAPGLFLTKASGIDEAKRIGFQEYLKEHYTLEEVKRYFEPQIRIASFDSVEIPKRSSPAYRLFFEYYDSFLTELLAEAQQVFPGLSMEVRLDVDPVRGLDGNMAGAGHFGTFPCKDAPYTALMYSVSMGQEEERLLTAQEALQTMEEQMNLVKAYNSGKPIYIDQLLYMDITPGFEKNARLLEEERNAYLTGLPALLRRDTNGYAVWSYRNYANNFVYNGQFALGDRDWEVSRGKVVKQDGSSRMSLENGGSISQDIGHRVSGNMVQGNHVRFTADSRSPVRLFVTLGSRTETVTVDGQGQFDLDFGKLEYGQVRFRAAGDIWLDNICVYNFVQDGQLYDLEGNELSCLEGVKELNRQLEP